ncbi:hypothetical protein ACFE04_018231 [Oxalis oulophora]
MHRKKFSISSINSPHRPSNRRKHLNVNPSENSSTDDSSKRFSLSETNSYESNENEFRRPVKENDSSYMEQSDSINQSINYSSNSTSPYINIAPLPIFHGSPKECPVTHLSRFVKVCRANNASSNDMMITIFPVTLENEAALWYDLNIEPYPSLIWQEITSSFLEAYNKKIDQLRYELVTINQGRGECVRSYFLRIQWVLKRWGDHGISDNVLKGIFVGGLRDEFKEWIVPRNPESLNEALRLAFSYEQANVGSMEEKDSTCGFCDGEHEETSCEVKARMRNIWRKYCKSADVDSRIEDLVDMTGGLELNKSCKCRKHQCWKKKMERNNSSSFSSRNSNAG